MLNLTNGSLSCCGFGFFTEMETTVKRLERGTMVRKYSWKKKSEEIAIRISKETGQLVWSCNNDIKFIDGVINLREVKEVRPGKFSKDFDRCPEDAKKIEDLKSFVVFYGSEFKLRVLSIVALSENESEFWISSLRYLVTNTLSVPYTTKVQAWLRREFHAMENSKEVVNLKDLKAFFPRINCKISTSRLREVFNEVDTCRRSEIGFDDFMFLYQKIILDENRIEEIFDKIKKYSPDLKRVYLHDLASFLADEQSQPIDDDRSLSTVMCNFLDDPMRDIQDPFFTVSEFVDFLFSKQNEVWNSAKESVYQDMSKPLSHYWIASSHNSYLTGDQISSESSVEAYVRCLRMGCRCIELDCWDGPEGMPLIHHGNFTWTTRIEFLDVIKTIKEHAFSTSEYPVILSIEDNCSLPQQRKMASAMQEVFGEMLLVQSIDKNEKELPSPQQLKRRIILKHKKLPEGQEEADILLRYDGKEMDLRNSIKNGILYLEDPVENEWNPHYFVLTNTRLYYTDTYRLDSEADRSEDEEESDSFYSNIPNAELHFSEKWFHGGNSFGRDDAELLLKTYSHFGDGTFLVRRSATFVGEYCLSFWRCGRVHHCMIKTKQVRQQTKFYLMDVKSFDSLYSLITFYRMSPLVTPEFAITLQEPVPQPKTHETEIWYHKNTGKIQAEEILKAVKIEGAFLVRPSENDLNCYTISFRAEKKVKHCRTRLEGRLYTIGNAEFESLVELVHHYEDHPFYKKVKLTLPIGEDAVRKMSADLREISVDNRVSYMDPRCLVLSGITVKAVYDYQAQRSDELSFRKQDIIFNVTKPENSQGWWQGDLGNMKQGLFPENYVVEIDNGDQQDPNDGSDDSMLQGHLDLNGATVHILKKNSERLGLEWGFRIVTSSACTPFEVALNSENMALEWISSIHNVTQKANALECQNRQMERARRIAKEISNLIVYCRSVAFNLERAKNSPFVFNQMSSFSENKAEKFICYQERLFFLKYHQNQLSRVYPKGIRFDSSNYNPINFWICGSQMVALNYQTGDKPMQLNQAKFRDNGACGYLLKPECMLKSDFDPFDKTTLVGVEPLTVTIRVIAARHLNRPKRGIASPLVEIEVQGSPYDTGVKLTTKSIADNGLNPIWLNSVCKFDVFNPELALLIFQVLDEDSFRDYNLIGQGIYPLSCLRTGYRSVCLKNAFSEDLELASLLIHLSIKKFSELPKQ